MNEKPPDWQERLLGDLCEQITKGTTPGGYIQDGVNFIKVESISQNGDLIESKFAKISRDEHEYLKRSQLQPGDILFSIAGTLGRAAAVEPRHLPANTNQALAIIRIKGGEVDRDYCLKYLTCQGAQSHLKALQTIGAQPNLSLQQISEIQIPIPPLSEQKKIAEILSRIDHATNSVSRRIAKEEALFISLQHKLLSGIAGAAFALPRHQDEAFKILPVARLFEVQLGKMLNKQAKEHGRQFQYIGNKNVQQWNPDLRQLESMHFSDSERKKFALKPFDLLVCEGGDAGRCCIWDRRETEIYYQKAIHRMRPINNDCLPTFMMHYLSYCKANNLLSDFISRTSISHLTREKLLEVPVALPTHQEQSSIADRLELQRKLISKLLSKLKILKDLKSAVASDLLSGRKRVSV